MGHSLELKRFCVVQRIDNCKVGKAHKTLLRTDYMLYLSTIVMKNIYKIRLFILLCLGIFLCVACLSSCTNKSDEETGCVMPDLRPLSLDSLNTCKTPIVIDVNLPENEYTIIQTQERFNELVTPSQCFTPIDFSKYELVIGKKQLSSNLADLGYELAQSCESNLLNITLKKGRLTIAPIVVYHLLIPKSNIPPTVKVEVTDF